MVRHFEPMKVSPSDRCSYRALELDNKMIVFLIHDPTTETAAASLDVHVGSLRDPPEYQGLAHFLEHMLFVGSEKYPGASDFSDYLSQNGGDFNAWTGLFSTNYHFEVKDDRLPQALDIFAHFFAHPLFSAALTFKEIHAVNSEAEMYYTDDSWRYVRLQSLLCSQDALLAKYDVGNLDTLGGLRGIVAGRVSRDSGDVGVNCGGPKCDADDKDDDLMTDDIEKRKGRLIQALKEFHSKYYSANQMVLSVYAKSGLDEMEDLVKSTFSAIENKNLTYEGFKNEKFPFPEAKLQKQVKVLTLNKGTTVKLAFKLEEIYNDVHFKSAEYLVYILGHESEGSMLYFLQQDELAVTLKAELERKEDFYTSITISIALSKKGTEPKNLRRIISVVGAYINMLKHVGPQKWIYDEIAFKGELSFRYHEADTALDTCLNITERFYDFIEPTNILYSPFEYREFKENTITKLVESLTPENMILVYLSDQLDKMDDIDEYQTDEIYKTRYLIEPLQDDLSKCFKEGDISWSNQINSLELPRHNPFFPKDFEVRQPEVTTKEPSRIHESDRSQIWHLQDAVFLQPRMHLFGIIYLDKAKIFQSCDQNVKLSMWLSLLNNRLNSMIYTASIAQISCHVVQSKYGISIQISSFSSSLAAFMDRLAHLVYEFVRDGYTREQFALLRHKLEVDMHEERNDTPANYLDSYLRTYVTDTPVTLNEAIQVAENLKYEDMVIFGSSLFDEVRFSWLAEGCLDKQEVSKLTINFEDRLYAIFKCLPLPTKQVNARRAVRLEPAETVIVEEVSHLAESKNSCFMKLYQVSKEDYRDHRHLVMFLESYLMNPYFESLRTEQNLGYSVCVSARTKSGVHHIACKVQSDVKTSHFCIDRSYEFMKEREQMLEAMSQDEFNGLRDAMRSILSQPPKSMAIQIAGHWKEIKSHDYLFNRNELISQKLESVTKEEVLIFFRKVILHQPRIFEVHLYSQATKEESIAHRKERQEKQEENIFKVFQSVADVKEAYRYYPDEDIMTIPLI